MNRGILRHPLLGPASLRPGAGDATIAWRGGYPVTRAQLLADVLATAAQLPAHTHVLNVCNDRYHFLVGFAAAVLQGQVSLLPPSRVPGALQEIATDYPDVYLLVDGPLGDGALPQFRLHLEIGREARSVASFDPANVPQIPGDRQAAILFTSGSTGQAMPNPKTWDALVRGAVQNAQALRPLPDHDFTVVATVPSQHMYGFENTIMVTLQGHCAVQCDRPLYPDDVRRALEATPEPRLLLTTPVHLKVLAESAGPQPSVTGILCATAPLTAKLAAQAEAKFGAPVKEAFGCTEAGVMATRRTVLDEPWQLLDLFTVEARPDRTLVYADHLPETVVMQDVIEPVDARRFRLIGRGRDLVNIAGKRASLGDLNARLLSIPGVQDGVIFMPAQADADGQVVRTTAFVVAPGMTREQVLAALRQLIDPAFLPRPLYLVDSLPRSESSKLPRAALLDLLARQPGEPGT